MRTSRVFQILTSLAIGAGLICGQQARAQDSHHSQIKLVPHVGATVAGTPAPDLYALQAMFTQVNPVTAANTDGSDLWPCFGSTSSPNPDCPVMGNPAVPFPSGGVVVGFPSYVWKLRNPEGTTKSNSSGFGCDALVNGTTGPLVNGPTGPIGTAYKPCGQIATWYEDTTNDSTDDLLQRIVVTQGSTIIYDSGTVNYGPAGPNVHYPVDVILNTDANFGVWPGAGTGPNNGNCSADTGYPLTVPENPGKVYIIAAGQTCHAPVPGPAVFTTSTVLGTPNYTKATRATCTAKGVASPCYTVEWTKRNEIRQDFKIFLE
jgi:hypothetical protein